jgi:DNA primase catalytic core
MIQNFETAIDQIKPHLPAYLEEQGVDVSTNFTCPFPDHRDSNPSAHVVGKNSDTPRVYCLGCGRHADIFDLVQMMEDKPTTGVEWVQDTLRYLAEKYEVELQLADLTEEEMYELDTHRAYRAAARLLKTEDLDPVRHADFIAHMKKRGWHPRAIAQFNVGTVTSYSEFRKALKTEGFPGPFLDEIDLGREDIFNPKNLIFTWIDHNGRPIGFTSRNLQYEEEKAEAEKKGVKYSRPKYNNQRTTGLKCNIFQKGRRLYGIDEAVQAVKKSRPIYIFEGQADVITARTHGLPNCVALAGSSLHDHHVHLLKQIGAYDLILCLDGDETGKKKLAEILQEKLAGHRDLRVRVIELPEGEDPDSYIRSHGRKGFNALAMWSAFEWQLNRFEETDDQEQICRQMIPFLLNESSPILREQMGIILSRRTGISLKAIIAEVDQLLDQRAHQASRERQSILEKTIYELRNNPSEAEMSLQQAQDGLRGISQRNSKELLSSEDFVHQINEQKRTEEEVKDLVFGYELGEDLKELQEVLRGEWSKDVFMCFAGKANSGKTSLMAKMAYEIATNNEDVCVIYHTIDDTGAQLIPRFVTIGEGSRSLSINMVRQPLYWQNLGVDGVIERRDLGYIRLRKLAQEGRLIMKDINHGCDLPFAENLILYYKERYPDRRIVYILDNIHKLRDFDYQKDERVRFKAISEACKGIATRNHITFMGSVEYTKLAAGIRPGDNNIAETVQLQYDANFIAHVYNEMGDSPDSFTVCHRGKDWQNREIWLPRVELIIGKNKITEVKGSVFLDFWPASSDYRTVSRDLVVREAREMKETRGDQRYSPLEEAEKKIWSH